MYFSFIFFTSIIKSYHSEDEYIYFSLLNEEIILYFRELRMKFEFLEKEGTNYFHFKNTFSLGPDTKELCNFKKIYRKVVESFYKNLETKTFYNKKDNRINIEKATKEIFDQQYIKGPLLNLKRKDNKTSNTTYYSNGYKYLKESNEVSHSFPNIRDDAYLIIETKKNMSIKEIINKLKEIFRFNQKVYNPYFTNLNSPKIIEIFSETDIQIRRDLIINYFKDVNYSIMELSKQYFLIYCGLFSLLILNINKVVITNDNYKNNLHFLHNADVISEFIKLNFKFDSKFWTLKNGLDAFLNLCINKYTGNFYEGLLPDSQKAIKKLETLVNSDFKNCPEKEKEFLNATDAKKYFNKKFPKDINSYFSDKEKKLKFIREATIFHFKKEIKSQLENNQISIQLFLRLVNSLFVLKNDLFLTLKSVSSKKFIKSISR